jgi:hypothetical protein
VLYQVNYQGTEKEHGKQKQEYLKHGGCPPYEHDAFEQFPFRLNWNCLFHGNSTASSLRPIALLPRHG